MKKNRNAFSLIELSIVILIIGILIAGVTQSSRSVAKMRLTSARTLTQSSPVAGIRNLVLWLETTSEKSFDDLEAQDATAVTNWYDINPQSIQKNNGTSSGTTRPLYTDNVLNGLPVLRFDGVNDAFNLPDGTIPYNDSQYSVFVVSKITATCDCIILTSGTMGTTNISNGFRYMPTNRLRHWWWNNDIDATAGSVLPNQFYVLEFHYNQATRSIYINGTNNITAVPAPMPRTSGSNNNAIGLAVAGGIYLAGDIAEIIIFDRALKLEERDAVAKYLGKKWGIKVS
jgi:prepilin-type N-terminal cleavage/methylation domain-containing protein